MVRFFWYSIQIATFFGTIWFSTEIAPADATLGAKALFGAVMACLVTAALYWSFRLLAWSRQKCIQYFRNPRVVSNPRTRLPD